MSVTYLGDSGQSAAASAGAVPSDGLGHHLQDELLAVGLGHLLPVHVVHHAVQEGGAGASDADGLSHTHPAHRHSPHLSTPAQMVIPSH